jgi:hypothetical protein
LEQAESVNEPKIITRQAQYIELGSFACFVAFLAYLAFQSFGTQIQDLTYTLVALSALLYLSGQRIRKYSVVSASWAFLGMAFVTSWIIASGLANLLSVFIWVAALLTAYEFNRFAFTIQSTQPIIGNLDMSSVRKYERVIRSHTVSTLVVISASVMVSLLVTSFSEGLLIIVAPPVLGITIFAFLAILVITYLIARANYWREG